MSIPAKRPVVNPEEVVNLMLDTANEYFTTYGGDVIHLIRTRDLLHQQLTEAIKGELERAELAERGEQDRQVHVPDELLAQD